MATYTYSRFSTDNQSEASIIDQQRIQREWAARDGVSIDRDFVDEGISGVATGNRPDFLRMMDAVRSGDMIVLFHTDRLARSQDLAPLITRLRFRGVRVVGILDGFDSNTSHSDMQAGLSGILSAEFISRVRKSVHIALETRARTGRPTGGRAYGYNNAGQLVEPEASVAREIFTRYANGESMHSIVTDLNARGVPSPGATWNRKARRRDGRWLISALHAMLSNDRYTGRVVWNRSVWVKDPDSGKRIRRERPESEWIVNEGPALIDSETWARIRARLRERATVYGVAKGGQPRYLLSGILVCESCSGRLIIAGNRGTHYYCGTYRGGGPSACSMGIGVRRSIAETVVLRPVREGLLSPVAIERACSMIRHWHRMERARSVQTPSPELARVDAAIADLEGLIAEDPARGEVLGIALEAQRQRRGALMRQAWRQVAALGDNDDVPAERAYRAYVTRMGELLDSKNVAGARDVLRNVLRDVPVWPHESGSHLMAQVGVNAVALLRAVGVDWVGSGGRI